MSPEYPESRRVDHVDDYHGTAVADPYRWLEAMDSDETRAWIAKQNELTFGYLESIPMRERLRERLTEIWDYPKHFLPLSEGGRVFFRRQDGLQNQPVLFVRDGEDSEPRTLLDPNALSEDGTVAVNTFTVSRDGRHLAWAESRGGSDWMVWRIRSVDTGEDLPDRVEWSKFCEAVWDERGAGFYYCRYAEPDESKALKDVNLGQQLCYHRLGTKQGEDVVVYERPDQPEWGFGAYLAESGDYLFLHVWLGTDPRNLLFVRNERERGAPFVELIDRFEASYDVLGHDGETLYLLTDRDATRKRVVAVSLANPTREHWREVVPETGDAIDYAALVNGDEIVVNALRDARSVLSRYRLDGTALGEVPLPGLGTVFGPVAAHRDDRSFPFIFTSFLSPAGIHSFDFASGRSQCIRESGLKFDGSRFVTRQVFFPSKDGTRIPMFLVHRTDLELDGNQPTLLYGYGGFNVSLSPGFSIGNLAWLEMGGVYAVANLRGGGEYGEAWHDAGVRERKQNVFDDFIAAAEWLIAEGYTRPERLACQGGSNGGLLVGAVINQRPDLFAAALPGVGVMDMLRYQEFTIGWAWASDFGTSAEPEMFPVLHAYSPYHNLKDGERYPAVLVTTADHDDRVVPLHSFKYAARLQAAQGGDAPVLIRVDVKAGHGMGKPTDKIIATLADQWAFLWRNLGMDAP